MTSNVGSVTGDYDEAIRQSFKPEFINRLDDIVVFERLDREQIATIVDLQVRMLVERVAERGIAIELTDDARTLIGNLGYDPVYGARPLKRVIQKRLVDPLALKILDGTFAEGDTVLVDGAGGELVLAAGAQLS
jgi:ATP-dependent Clp protease ATP-binding subunit ClpB